MNPHVEQLALNSLRLGTYSHDISWPFKPGVDYREYAIVKAMGGSSAIVAWLVQKVHAQSGVQMQVSREVSDDLRAADFSESASIENVPWLAPTVELYFEDQSLPAIIVMKSSPDEIRKRFPMLEVDLKSGEYISAIMQEGHGSNAQVMSLNLKPSMYEEFLATATTPAMETGLLSGPLSEIDNAVICYMLHLALKVMVFASIPHFRPEQIHRKQMHWGGKPGVKGRPKRPALKVAYLPRVQAPAHRAARPHSRSFAGRRGHIRWYHSEKFTNRRGTWDFIGPVVDPKTGKYPVRVLKVRRPK